MCELVPPTMAVTIPHVILQPKEDRCVVVVVIV
jgi:hypothetical protein